MRVEQVIRYPVGPEAVASMLADPQFVERKCAAMGALSHDADVTGDASGAFTVSTRRTMPTDDLPDIARKFVGETLDIRQVDAWEPPAADGSRAGTVVVEIVGAPLRLTGTQRLDATDSGTRQVLTGELKASVPLIGGKLEKAAEPAILAAVRKEQQVGSAWLNA